jgi:hypothetical protein
MRRKPAQAHSECTMSVPLDNIVLSFALRGWRDRSTGTMHLGPCLDFESLDAERIENTVWRPEESYDRLCPSCFPLGDGEEPNGSGASESHGL